MPYINQNMVLNAQNDTQFANTITAQANNGLQNVDFSYLLDPTPPPAPSLFKKLMDQPNFKPVVIIAVALIAIIVAYKFLK